MDFEAPKIPFWYSKKAWGKSSPLFATPFEEKLTLSKSSQKIIAMFLTGQHETTNKLVLLSCQQLKIQLFRQQVNQSIANIFPKAIDIVIFQKC